MLQYLFYKRFPVLHNDSHRIGSTGQTFHVDAFHAVALDVQ